MANILVYALELGEGRPSPSAPSLLKEQLI